MSILFVAVWGVGLWWPLGGAQDANKCKDEYTNAVADMKKLGVVIQADSNQKLADIDTSIETSGRHIATSALVNLIVNKLTPLPVAKSRAAFIREYESSTKDLKFEADPKAKDWLSDLTKQAAVQERKPIKPKMSPKKRSA